jgi:serine/threonine protein kinase
MSPEQTLGREADHRTDIFSLGVVMYEMTTGRRPFSGADAGEMRDRILHAQPEAISRFNYDVPAELERIIRKCLEKDRERRYQSAHELLIDLRNLKRDLDSGEGVAVHPTSSAEYLVSEIKRHRRGALITLTVIVLAAAAADVQVNFPSPSNVARPIEI